MNRTELKQTAKDWLRNNWTWAVLLTLLTEVIVNLVTAFTWGIGGLITGVVWASFAFTFLDLIDGHKEDNYFTAMFSAFTNAKFWPVFLTWLLQSIFTALWSLLFVIPGIIKGLAYSQSYFIAKDILDSGQHLEPTEAITKSRQLMDGHKWEFFVLQLSFLGWAILACCTFGIGFLWLIPYMKATNAAYYRQLAGNSFKVIFDHQDNMSHVADL